MNASPAQETSDVNASPAQESVSATHPNDSENNDKELKRKREELTSDLNESEEEDNKKAKLETETAAVNVPPYMTENGEYIEKLEVSPAKVGQVSTTLVHEN